MSAQKIIKAIHKYSKFLITAHVGLEGDALGSELALASLLNKMGKKAIIINESQTPDNYCFLPGSKKIRNISDSLNNNYAEAALVIDCSHKHRIGRVLNLVDKLPIINIDHHGDNKRFGQVNWVEANISSAGEMIYRLFKSTRTKIDKNDATNIFTAMSTDTGFFRHTNTSSATFQICSRLQKIGVDPALIYTKIYEDNSAQDALCLAKTISKIKFAAGNTIAWAISGTKEFPAIRDKHELSEKILDFIKSVSTVKVAIIFGQLNSRLIKVSLRSKPPVDVQKVALIFSGGGHKYACGCVIKGSLRAVQQAVVKEAVKALHS